MSQTTKIIVFAGVTLAVILLVKFSGHQYANAARLFLKNLFRNLF